MGAFELHVKRLSLKLLIATAIALGLVAFFVVNITDEPEVDDRYDLKQVAASVQQTVAYDFDSLAKTGDDLSDIEARAELVGSGEIVDVVEGYTVDRGTFADGVRDLEPHVLLIIEPSEISEGETLLGESDLIHIDQPASAGIDIEGMSDAVSGEGDLVAFFLTEVGPDGDNVEDEFAGRSSDDPLFFPTQLSTFLGVDPASDRAFPIFSDENLRESAANLEAMAAAGVEVDGFGRAPVNDAPLATFTP